MCCRWDDSVATFNSFEDETTSRRTVPWPGYSLSIPLRMKRNVEESGRWWIRLSIPLRMKRQRISRFLQQIKLDFQFLWGWNRVTVPPQSSVVYPQSSFNSFEDETLTSFQGVEKNRVLSIPLRMKLSNEVRPSSRPRKPFQFLWGWNLSWVAVTRRPSIKNSLALIPRARWFFLGDRNGWTDKHNSGLPTMW